MGGEPGEIYVLCFGRRKVAHAGHYVGWTRTGRVRTRIREHLSGHGSPLVAAAVANGAKVRLALTIPGDRHDERALKRRKSTPRLCPLCNPKQRTHALGISFEEVAHETRVAEHPLTTE